MLDADDVTVVVDEGLLGVVLEAVDVEVIEPEVGQYLAQLPLAVDHPQVGVEPRLLDRPARLDVVDLMVLPELGERLGKRGEAGGGVAVEAVSSLVVLGVVGLVRVGIQLLLNVGGEAGVIVDAERVEHRDIARTRPEAHAVQGDERDAWEDERDAFAGRSRRKPRERREELPARRPGSIAGNGGDVRHASSPGRRLRVRYEGRRYSLRLGLEVDESTARGGQPATAIQRSKSPLSKPSVKRSAPTGGRSTPVTMPIGL